MKCMVLRAACLGLLAGAPASAAPVTLTNAGFETQTPELAAGQFTANVSPWQETGGPSAAQGFLEYLAGFAAEGTDHLGMESGHDVWLDEGGNFLSNTVYTLTVATGNRPGQTAAGNVSEYALSTSTGAVYADGAVDAAAAVPAGTFAEAPVVVLDTVSEPAAVGKPIRVLLRARGTGRSHFDHIRLDATATAQNGRPLGSSVAVTSITGTGVTVPGNVSSTGGNAPAIRVYYGTADGGSDPADWQQFKDLPGTFNTGSFNTQLTGLTSGTLHYTRLRFTNTSGSTWAAVTRSFTTLTPPVVENLPLTGVTPVSATAGARVTAYSGNAPAVTLFYGPADGGTVPSGWAQSLEIGQTPGTSSGVLTGLQPSSTWFVRARAANNAGEGWAPGSLSFTTSAATPSVIATLPASGISPTGATLNAEVISTGNAAPAVTFYYGPTDGGTVAGAWAHAVSPGLQAGKTASEVTGLTPGTVYYFRAAAVNSAGTAWAPESLTFTAATVSAPAVVMLPATHVRGGYAVLSGTVTSTGFETPALTFFWGPADGGTVPASWQNSASLGTGSTGFSRVLSGLAPGSTIYYRTRAANSAGSTWSAVNFLTTPPADVLPRVLINEIHYDPADRTKPQEFIELHNPGTEPVDLTGWRISSGVEFTLGNVTIPAGGYFCVVQNPAQFSTTWPTAAARSAGPFTGKLRNDGETIELRDGNGSIVQSITYGAGFPWPTASRGAGPSMELLHPALDGGLGGSWRRASSVPTPGAANSILLTGASSAPPAIREVTHSPLQPVSNVPVTITATVTDPDGVGTVSLRYQKVSPGAYIRKNDAGFNNAANWITLGMKDDGTGGDAVAGDSVFTTQIPAAEQTHRRLIRYQITVTDTPGNSVRVPYPDDEQPNFAYFCHDGIPGWSGALRPTAFNGNAATPVENYPASLLQSIEPWHLIANDNDVINSQFNSESPYSGTLVHRGQVYDHITFNVRGIGSTTVSGKNKWGLKFSRARNFQAYDNWGRPYAETWNSLGLNACASPWAAVNRGSAGIEEALSLRLMELCGVPSLRTSYVHWRVVRRATEPASATTIVNGDPLGSGIRGQYAGDLWGLYMAMEPTEGNFLDERGMEDGSIYSIENSNGDKKHQGETQPAGTADWDAFRNASMQNGQTETWYRTNHDLPALYSFMGVNRLIGNVDVRPGDNFRYYRRPDDNRWVILPYDLDMMFIAAHHWGGSMDSGVVAAGAPLTVRAISRHAAIALEYRNRCRELLSLMASDARPDGGQIGQLIQEYASLVNPSGQTLTWADLDAAMWNLHPRTAGGGSNTGQSSHKGNFFRATYLDGTRGGLGGTAQTGSWIRNLPDPDSNGFSDHEGFVQWFTAYATNTYPATAAEWTRKATNSGGTGTDNDVNRQKGYGYKYLEWESLYGGYVNAVTNPPAAQADLAFPGTPVIFSSGAAGFPANDLRFTSSSFSDPQGSGTAAAAQWRLGEISAPGIPGFDPDQPWKYEIESVWTSGEIPLTGASIPEIRIPAAAVVPGRTYRARVRHKDSTGRWSHWSAPVQFIAGGVDTTPYQNALRLTEINYNPAPPTAAEMAHAQWDASWTSQQFEYLELTNISPDPLDLTDVRFTKGIDYDFAAGTVLAPGARLLVVKNPAAFGIRYGRGQPVAPGSFDPDSLSNSGEQLKLSFGAGLAIFDFVYSDTFPWPGTADGSGPSLVLISPAKPGLDHGNAWEWRASRQNGGNPGTDDSVPYAVWAAGYPGLGSPDGDPDGDGLTNLMEFALGTPPDTPSPDALPQSSLQDGAQILTFTWTPWHAGTLQAEFSTDLAGWAAGGTPMHRLELPDGRFTDTWRSPAPSSSGSASRQFGRLRFTPP